MSFVPETSHALAAGTRWRLLGVMTAHLVVDFFSYLIIPLLSVLEGRTHLTPAQGAIILATGSVSSGLIQPAVAVVGDRFDTRWIGPLGLLLAAVAMGLLGYVDSFAGLLALQAIGAAGVGAFHPPGAALMGHLSGRQRSLGVAVFYSAGMFGGILGNLSGPVLNAAFGLERFVWLIPAGVAFTAMLAFASWGVTHQHAHARSEHAALPLAERQLRWRGVWLLYAGNVLRFTVNMMMVKIIIRWTEVEAMHRAGLSELDASARQAASQINGPLQSAMQIGMGITGLAVGFLVAERRHRDVLIWVPCLGALAIGLFPLAASSGVAFLLAVVAGVAYGGIMPITITMAQRLLPHRTSLASGLMMGGAWSIAGIGPSLAQILMERAGMVWACEVTALLLVVSGVMGYGIQPPEGPASRLHQPGRDLVLAAEELH